MFAAYGYRSSTYTELTTPVTLSETNCKSLKDISFFSNELKKYVEEFCSNYIRNIDKQIILNFIYISKVNGRTCGFEAHYKDPDNMQNYEVQSSDDALTPTDLHHFIVMIFTAIYNELSGKILRDTLQLGSNGKF
ncbi:8127_t:CDS:2 [Gigaspora rosea]|nr:8127_t:CDS:2 [Gigaspora rosea]